VPPAHATGASTGELRSAPPWWQLGLDGKALIEIVVGSVVGLIALFSSYVHVTLPHRQLPVQQQWGIWPIALSLPHVLIDTQLASRSRQRDADRALKAEIEAAVDEVGRRPKNERVQIEKEIEQR